ncbi:hypothetical protein UA08_02817 [Talaromyces atroroseus]|uniref:Protein kinase domain-containing protein n=1 Tax=Talaromyces atroroseus TaxID=1441469 RepID=A0A225AWP2_TALAT|nr:hypothetical protein UA08_02817 [Talaromyces atroroseus]OKL61738.1 hypothetical protein UA08_02817 [Talaromyces atroroseus]
MCAYDPWDYNWEGNRFRHKGVQYVIEEQLTEEENVELAQRHVLTLAHEIESGRQFMLKLSYDLDPEEFDIEDEDEHEEMVCDYSGFEADLVNFLHGIGHEPKLLDAYGYLQGENHPYESGAIYFIAMECVPGENVDEIRDELTKEELQSIRRQLAYILNEMAKINRCFANEDPACLRYDRRADKLYVVDLTH